MRSRVPRPPGLGEGGRQHVIHHAIWAVGRLEHLEPRKKKYVVKTSAYSCYFCRVGCFYLAQNRITPEELEMMTRDMDLRKLNANLDEKECDNDLECSF